VDCGLACRFVLFEDSVCFSDSVRSLASRVLYLAFIGGLFAYGIMGSLIPLRP
jgi:hypothetical protein